MRPHSPEYYLKKRRPISYIIKNSVKWTEDERSEVIEYLETHKICMICGGIFEVPKIHKASHFICGAEVCKEKYVEWDKIRVENILKTKEERYGGLNWQKKGKKPNYNNIEKQKQTLRERYGVENISQIPGVKEKKIANYKAKTGFDWPSQNEEVKKKKIQTNLKNRGVEYPLQSKECLKKAEDTMEKRFGVRHAALNPEIAEKIRKTNRERTGYDCNLSDPNFKNGLTQKDVDSGYENVSQKNIKNFSDYKSREFWLLNFYVEGVYQKFKAMEYFGICATSALKIFRSFGAPHRVEKDTTRTQDKIFDLIQAQDKIHNAKNIIRRKELDIYVPSAKLAIEYNGLLFHSQGISNHSMLNTPDYPKDYHLQKTLECKLQGIQLLHIFEGEDIDLWLSVINAKLGLNTRIYARNCCAAELRNSDLGEFLDANHLQGFCNASIAIGLYTKDTTKVGDIETNKLAAVMTFSKPRFSKGYDYELVRFCSLKGYSITGGASKLWKFFLKKYAPKSVISYANLRFSNGELYEKLGFSLKHRSEPNYYYFKPNEGILHSRNKFQKHKLKDLLENFDADKSEVENMFANGYRRIFDCGNLVYVWLANSVNS